MKKQLILKYLFITLGSISLGFGIAGFIVPGLPVTPFMLLCGYLYARSSPKLYAKLESHKITGRYLKKGGGGLSLKEKLISLALMWTMISITTFVVFKGNLKAQYIMIGLGVVGTISQVLFFRKRKKVAETVLVEENPVD